MHLRPVTCQALGALVMFTALSSSVLAQAAKPADKPVAVINGEPITRSEFESIWSRVPPAPPNTTDAQRRSMQMQLLQTLIDETLFQQFLKKTVPAPDPVVVQQRIAELDKSLKARGKTLQQYYQDTGQSEARLQRDIAAVIQWNAYVKKHVTEADMKRYYEDNRELFDGVMIRASHIFVRVARDADPRTLAEARQRVQAIRNEILKGADFAETAKKYSQDSTAPNGGDLGYFPPAGRTEQDPFLRTVSAMRVGQVSDVVTTDHGLHIIKVTDRKAGKPTTYEEAKEDARALVAEDLRGAIVAEQRKVGKIEFSLP